LFCELREVDISLENQQWHLPTLVCVHLISTISPRVSKVVLEDH